MSEPQRPGWLPPLPVASLLILFVALTGFDVLLYVKTLVPGAVGADFSRFYLGSRLALEHGWAAPYSRSTWVRAAQAYFHTNSTAFYYTNPPWQLWVLAPLARLPETAALAIWNTVLFASLVGAWYLATTWARRPPARLLLLLSATASFPVAFAYINGQASIIVMLGLAGCAWLALHDRPYAAGLALLLTLFKPQASFLAGPALMVAGRWRELAGYAAGAVVLSAATAISLGRQGLVDWQHTLKDVGVVEAWQRYTPQFYVPSGLPATGIELTLPAIALFAAWRRRHLGIAPVLAAAVLGSVLAAPYLNPQDLAALLVVGWLCLPVLRAPWVAAAMLAQFLAILLAQSYGAGLYLVPALAWLGALAFLPERWLVGPQPPRPSYFDWQDGLRASPIGADIARRPAD